MSASTEAGIRRDKIFLIAILLLGLVLRLGWWLLRAPVISIEAAEYLCAAQNLLKGHGLVGCYPGPELMYTPFYSILTAAISAAVRNIEVAAHLVSLVSSVCLILPVYFIASFIYDKRTGYIAALLTAVHPVLVKLGGSTYSEAVYLTLFMAGIYSGLRMLELRTARYQWLTGIWLGLAYVTRPEAFAYPLFFLLAIWTVAILGRRGIAAAGAASLRMFAVFIAIALPYVAYIYAHTGQLRLEGKWNINYTIQTRIQAGMDYEHAAYGIGAGADDSGPLLDPDHFAAYTPFRHGFREKILYLARAVSAHRHEVSWELRSSMLGNPAVFFLIIIGFFRKAWQRRRLLNEFVLLAMALSIVILIATAQHVENRYLFALLPLLIIWSAKGIEELGEWTAELVRALKTRLLPGPELPRAAVQVGAIAAVALLSLRGSSGLFEFYIQEPLFLPAKQAALWLGNFQPGRKAVASFDSRIAFYSDAVFVQLPDAAPAATLRYLAARNPDFIYIDNILLKSNPIIGEWLAHGIPDGFAELVYETKRETKRETKSETKRETKPETKQGEDIVRIYRWLQRRRNT
jgi:hypothetical protein